MIFINQILKGKFRFMITNFKKLVHLCEDELTDREYAEYYHNKISYEWERLSQWMTDHGYSDFNKEVGYKYCDEIFGTHILNGLLKKSDKTRLRAIRMLISYQKDGDFEFRTPRVEHCFRGNTGKEMLHYFLHLRDTVQLSENTLNNKENYLYSFNIYLENHFLALDDLSISEIENFYKTQNYSLASKHNCNSTLRLYLKYAFDKGMTEKDCSIFILPDNYKKIVRYLQLMKKVKSGSFFLQLIELQALAREIT